MTQRAAAATNWTQTTLQIVLLDHRSQMSQPTLPYLALKATKIGLLSQYISNVVLRYSMTQRAAAATNWTQTTLQLVLLDHRSQMSQPTLPYLVLKATKIGRMSQYISNVLNTR